MLQLGVENTYAEFLRRVAAARNLPVERVDRIAQGRVWDGGTARQIGLTDQYGGLDEALEWVAARAELGEGEWHPVYLGEQVSAYDSLLRRLLIADNGEARAPHDLASFFGRRERAVVGQFTRELEWMLSGQGVQAYCMECAAPIQADSAAAELPRGWLARLIAYLSR